jgi:hypothetical protein
MEEARTMTDDLVVTRLYRAASNPELIQVPELAFLMIDGHGDPNTSPRYQEAVGALYAVSYAAKFALERSGGPDIKVAPLEGLWWAKDMTSFTARDKAEWDWTMMIRQPDSLDDDLVHHLAGEVAEHKNLRAALELRLERFAEGDCAQVLHRGPFTDEGPTIDRLHTYIRGHGLTRRGKHHEIYLSDIRRAAPENWKTIIRQPVTPGHTAAHQEDVLLKG